MLSTDMLVGYLAATSLSAGGDYVSGDCPLLGPDFAVPTGLSDAPLIQEAIGSFPDVIKNATYGAVTLSKSTFSASVFSAADNKTIYSWYNTADSVKKATTGVTTVTGDSVYRLGSISKLLTVYAMLMEVGDTHWSDPVTMYIPELQQAASNASSSAVIDQVQWQDVTLGELAGHMSGVARDATLGDLSAALGSLGPKVPASAVPTCGAIQSQHPCSRSQFFGYLFQHHPSYPTAGTSPAYSNTAFALMGYVIEALTNSTMEAVMQKLFSKAGMTNAAFNQSDPKTGVIPFGNQSLSWWNVPTGNEAAAGGYFASNNDMVSLGQSMLHSSILSPAMTRRWMKPDTMTADINFAVGKPWEIRRIRDSNNKMTDYYTKEGELGSYSSLLVLSPDHQVGIAVNTADNEPTDSSVLHTVTNALVGQFMPAVEETARQQASKVYGGKYTDMTTNSSVEIATDSRTGMSMSNLILGGKDVLAELALLQQHTKAPSARLYPTGLTATSKSSSGSGTYVSRIGFKAVYQYLPLSDPQKGAFASNCESWFVVDSNNYGMVGLDEVQFGLTESGAVQWVQVRALQAEMKKS